MHWVQPTGRSSMVGCDDQRALCSFPPSPSPASGVLLARETSSFGFCLPDGLALDQEAMRAFLETFWRTASRRHLARRGFALCVQVLARDSLGHLDQQARQQRVSDAGRD